MKWRESHFLDGQLVTSEHHDRHVSRGSQVPDFHGIVSRPCSDEVLILIEVH